MAKWIEYTGSDEQIRELKANTHGYIVRNIPPITGFILSPRIRYDFELSGISVVKFEYLICQPHPHAAIIKIWADTGCEVWVREPIDYAMTGYMYKDYATDQPNWNIPNAIFRLTPFED